MDPPILSVTSAQLAAVMTAFFWPFVRILALLATAPVIGDPVVPRQVKVALSALLALVLAPGVAGAADVPLMSLPGAWVTAQQVLIGVAIGFTMRIVFTAVQAAGEYIGLQMGLSFATFFDPASGGQTAVVARFLYMLAALIFLAVDGHLHLIALLAQSFDSVPVARNGLAGAGWMVVARAAQDIFTTGLMLALPVVTALLILNLAMGILNRASPQFSIFAVGFPLTLLAGVAMLYLLVPQLGAFLDVRFSSALDLVGRVAAALRP